ERVLPTGCPGNASLERRGTKVTREREIWLDYRAIRGARVEIEGRTDIRGQPRRHFFRKAAEHVELGAVGKADARPPGADIETTVVAKANAALDRGLFVRLAETAEAIVADDGCAARNGDAVFGFLGMGG